MFQFIFTNLLGLNYLKVSAFVTLILLFLFSNFNFKCSISVLLQLNPCFYNSREEAWPYGITEECILAQTDGRRMFYPHRCSAGFPRQNQHPSDARASKHLNLGNTAKSFSGHRSSYVSGTSQLLTTCSFLKAHHSSHFDQE